MSDSQRTDARRDEERHEFQFRGLWIPADVMQAWSDDKISPTEVLLLCYIDSLVRCRGDGCWASNAYLADKFRVSGYHVKRMIRHLKEIGFVQQVGTKEIKGRQHRLLETAWSRINLNTSTDNKKVTDKSVQYSKNATLKICSCCKNATSVNVCSCCKNVTHIKDNRINDNKMDCSERKPSLADARESVCDSGASQTDEKSGAGAVNKQLNSRAPKDGDKKTKAPCGRGGTLAHVENDHNTALLNKSLQSPSLNPDEEKSTDEIVRKVRKLTDKERSDRWNDFLFGEGPAVKEGPDLYHESEIELMRRSALQFSSEKERQEEIDASLEEAFQRSLEESSCSKSAVDRAVEVQHLPAGELHTRQSESAPAARTTDKDKKKKASQVVSVSRSGRPAGAGELLVDEKSTEEKSIWQEYDLERAEDLAWWLQKHNRIMRDYKLSSWQKEFRRLRQSLPGKDKAVSDRIDQVLDWYFDNVGQPYVPQAFCAKSFREKFLSIEAARERDPEVARERRRKEEAAQEIAWYDYGK